MTDSVTYTDEDLVYVDPDARVVVGRVEFNENGLPKALAMPSPVVEDDDDEPDPSSPAKTDSAGSSTKPAATKGKIVRRPRKPRQRFYPWGTYRSMRKLYKLEGKVIEPERTLTLDDVMAKALQEPYWD